MVPALDGGCRWRFADVLRLDDQTVVGSVNELNKLIHEPARLRIMATLMSLSRAEQIDFGSLAKLLELSDGNLGSHLQKLEAAEYIEVEKTFEGKRPKTFVALTTTGRKAFRKHVKALERILYEDPSD